VSAATPARPIFTMNTAKAQRSREPHGYGLFLRPDAYDGDHWPAARICPIVFGTIPISWNDIAVPVRSLPHDRHSDQGPCRWGSSNSRVLRMRSGPGRALAEEDQRSPQCSNYCPHGLPCWATQSLLLPLRPARQDPVALRQTSALNRLLRSRALMQATFLIGRCS
jgi:hypothetical protein